MNIALIGMMGTMKTSVGKELAALTGLDFADSDDEFVRTEGASIAAVFQTKGERYFRARETEIVMALARREGTVISCGGGVPLRRENVKALRSSCVVVQLTATPERIRDRTAADGARPLLSGGGLARIKTLCAERKAFYEAACDFTVDTTDLTPREAAAQIVALLAARGAGPTATDNKTI